MKACLQQSDDDTKDGDAADADDDDDADGDYEEDDDADYVDDHDHFGSIIFLSKAEQNGGKKRRSWFLSALIIKCLPASAASHIIPFTTFTLKSPI